jgi:hypothetical protein
MSLPLFNQNYTSLSAQAFRDGKPADAGTIGPYPRVGNDPAAIKNGFVARLEENPPAKSFYDTGFFNKAAQKKQNFYNQLGTNPNFADERDTKIGKDFLAKYVEGAEQRGLIPVDEMVSPENSRAFMSQQPAEGIGSSNIIAADRIKPPGSSFNV